VDIRPRGASKRVEAILICLWLCRGASLDVAGRDNLQWATGMKGHMQKKLGFAAEQTPTQHKRRHGVLHAAGLMPPCWMILAADCSIFETDLHGTEEYRMALLVRSLACGRLPTGRRGTRPGGLPLFTPVNLLRLHEVLYLSFHASSPVTAVQTAWPPQVYSLTSDAAGARGPMARPHVFHARHQQTTEALT